jgi:hypothetical protein
MRLNRWANLSRWLLLFFAIFAAKLWVIRQYGSSVPQMDQWSGEAWKLYKPYLEGKLAFADLFAAHNEHRIFFSRLLYLLLLKANGLWEPLLQMVVQAAMHAAAIAFYFSPCSRSLSGRQRVLLLLATSPLWLLPFGWENTLIGFQSPFYFVALFGILSLWLCWRFETLSLGWWLCPLTCVCALFNMAGGLFVPVACAFFMVVRIWNEPKQWLRQLIGLALLAGLAVWGFELVPVELRNGQYKASSLGQLLGAWFTTLSWPCGGAWAFLILQAPFVLLGIALFRRRVASHDPAWLPLALGMWGWVQALATAYGRANLTLLAPRYLDTFCLTLIASLACLMIWALRFCPSSNQKRSTGLIGLWIVALTFGALRYFAHETSDALLTARDLTSQQEATVKAYLESHDASLLTERPIPFPDAAELKTWLDDPVLAAIMPARLRPALHSSRQMSGDGFGTRSYFRNGGISPPDGLHYWSSYGFDVGPTQRAQMELKFGGANKPRWLEIFVSGEPGAKNMALELTDKNGQVHNLAPFFDPGMEWKSELVKIPPGSFTLSAKDDSDTAWLAFSNPREVGWLSTWVERISGVILEWIVPGVMALIAAWLALFWIGPPEGLNRSKTADLLSRIFTGRPLAQRSGESK